MPTRDDGEPRSRRRKRGAPVGRHLVPLRIRSSAPTSIVIRPGERIVADAIAPPVWAAKMKVIPVVAAACVSVRSPERGLTCFGSDPGAMQSDSARLRWYRRSQALPADGRCR